jgi:hypothetical protein
METDTERETQQGRIALALEALDEHIKGLEGGELAAFLDDPDYSGTLHEIANGCVPVYNADILDVAASDHDVSLREPEIGPAFDGTPTPINIAAANIYELIEEALWADIRRRKEGLEETAE